MLIKFNNHLVIKFNVYGYVSINLVSTSDPEERLLKFITSTHFIHFHHQHRSLLIRLDEYNNLNFFSKDDSLFNIYLEFNKNIHFKSLFNNLLTIQYYIYKNTIKSLYPKSC